MSHLPDLVAAACTAHADYPRTSPYHPSESYPEYPYRQTEGSAPLGALLGTEPNEIYAAVRESLRLAGLDAANFGTSAWNPLGQFIRPGQFVLLKPNLVKEWHPRDPDGWIYVITHGSVIRAVADYVWIALAGRGRVMVADAPQTDSKFSAMVKLMELDRLADFYRGQGQNLELVDLRKEEWENVDEVIVERRKLAGDPCGYQAYDLADRSEFFQHAGVGRYYGADYDDDELNRHHTADKHEYLISGSAVACDVYINLPKLKTHKKAGITVNLKNLVGVNGDKNWLPHHTVGTPADGGDQFPNRSWKTWLEHTGAQTLRKTALALPGVGTWLLKRARRAGKKAFGDGNQTIRSGNWHGNDTTWRMCLDLNKIVLYGRPDGTFRPAELPAAKPYLCFVDGVLGGEGNGPMDPDPLASRCILFGSNPGVVDAASAVILGYDVDKIPIVRQAFHARGFPISTGNWREKRLASNRPEWNGTLGELTGSAATLHTRPHFGWVGHIEAARTK
ncbi:MAG: DUF362 domain-containing protein [Pirellulales bacterium]|nr:DUF362 domain-containing protein [Pirellulales bacterium]